MYIIREDESIPGELPGGYPTRQLHAETYWIWIGVSRLHFCNNKEILEEHIDIGPSLEDIRSDFNDNDSVCDRLGYK